jgi:hypothetical protein
MCHTTQCWPPAVFPRNEWLMSSGERQRNIQKQRQQPGRSRWNVEEFVFIYTTWRYLTVRSLCFNDCLIYMVLSFIYSWSMFDREREGIWKAVFYELSVTKTVHLMKFQPEIVFVSHLWENKAIFSDFYTECTRRALHGWNYIDVTKQTFVRSWMVTEMMKRRIMKWELLYVYWLANDYWNEDNRVHSLMLTPVMDM